jgi:polyhydroxyalkanoate synthesis regulator phasin
MSHYEFPKVILTDKHVSEALVALATYDEDFNGCPSVHDMQSRKNLMVERWALRVGVDTGFALSVARQEKRAHGHLVDVLKADPRVSAAWAIWPDNHMYSTDDSLDKEGVEAARRDLRDIAERLQSRERELGNVKREKEYADKRVKDLLSQTERQTRDFDAKVREISDLKVGQSTLTTALTARCDDLAAARKRVESLETEVNHLQTLLDGVKAGRRIRRAKPAIRKPKAA